MNVLINEILKSLQEIELGLEGELTMTSKMEELMDSIALNKIPASWAKYAFPSTRPLGTWLDNLKHRLEQLNQMERGPHDHSQGRFPQPSLQPSVFPYCHQAGILQKEQG